MAEPVAAINSAAGIRDQYLTLLVEQLKNQNPLDPMDNSEMASQLAQFSQLEQLENQSNQLASMGNAFQQVLQNVQRDQATALLGKEITFPALDQAGRTVERSGVVESVGLANNQIALKVGDYILGLDSILEIRR